MGAAAGEYGHRAPAPRWMGIPLSTLSLAVLVIQNSLLILVMYYSRIMPSSGPRYITSTAVLLTEVVKLGICMTVALFEIAQEVSSSTSATTLFYNLALAVVSGDSWKLAIPAALYTVQHSLQYIAISHLDAATLQVTYQFKILPTAIFSILILRRSLTTQKWLALALLMFGVVLVQFPTSQHPVAASGVWHEVHKLHFPRSMEDLTHWRQSTAMSLHRRSATYEGIEEDMLKQNQERDSTLGLAAAILSCSASALGSVYFEKVLKEATGKVSIWIRNVQLSVYSIVPSLFIGVIFVDGENISKNGFFVGYNWIVWQVITLQALGGILVALAIHFTNNIAKSFATSLSILLSLCLSMIFFDFTITLNFICGTAIVLLATYLYNVDSSAPLMQVPPINITAPGSTDTDASEKPFSIKVPHHGDLRDEAITVTSRPGSPMHYPRKASGRLEKGYFDSKRE